MNPSEEFHSNGSMALLQKLKNLFSPASSIPSEGILETLADYFEYLSDAIKPETLKLGCDPALLEYLDAAILVAPQQISPFSRDLAEDIDSCLRNLHLSQNLGLIAAMEEAVKDLPSPLRFIAIRLSPAIGRYYSMAKDFGIDSALLLQAKVGLRRAANLIRHSEQIRKAFPEDGGDSAFAGSRQKKTAIAYLLGQLRISVESLPNSQGKSEMLEQVSAIEAEVSKPRPQWPIIISGLLVVMGAFADFKSLAPALFDSAASVAESIVQVVFSEGLPFEGLGGRKPEGSPTSAKGEISIPPRTRVTPEDGDDG